MPGDMLRTEKLIAMTGIPSGSTGSDAELDRPPNVDEPTELYGSDYYKSSLGSIPYERNSHWLNFFGGIADEIIRALQPRNVFDAGCAWGFLVEAFWDRGVEAHGIDISEYAISNVRSDMKGYCSVGSVAEPIRGGPYDLVTCIEVLEHVTDAESRLAIQQMVGATSCILLSSTPDDFEEKTHINVHPVLHWLKLFADHGFYPDLLFDASFLAPHAVLLRRRAEAMSDEVIRLFCEMVRNRIYRAAFL